MVDKVLLKPNPKKNGEMESNSSIKNTSLLPRLPNDKVDTTLSSKKNPFTVVAIGASAGGLEAITQLLQNLSPATGMAFIYVQHLSPDHKSMLSSILSKKNQNAGSGH